MYTTLKDISSKVAKKLNIPEEDVVKINQTYWKTVKEKLSFNMTHVYVNIKYLGNFKLKRKDSNNFLSFLDKSEDIDKESVYYKRHDPLRTVIKQYDTIEQEAKNYKDGKK